MAFLLLCFFVFFCFETLPLVDGKENKSFELSEWTVKVQLYEICDSVSTSISFITPPLSFSMNSLSFRECYVSRGLCYLWRLQP